MQPETVTCPGWAPGLNIPDGECVHCHTQKREHPKALQSRASGAVGGISPKEFAFADSGLAARPEMISPASSAAKVRPDIVFCRNCNRGLVIVGVDPDGYACPKCGKSGPKSKTPTGKPHSETHEMPPPEKTLNQRAFEDGLTGREPVAPADVAYMEWFGEGRRRRDTDMTASDAAAGIFEGETEDVPVDNRPDGVADAGLDSDTANASPASGPNLAGEFADSAKVVPIYPGGFPPDSAGVPAHETVQYADGSNAAGPGPLPRFSTEGSPAVSVNDVPIAEVK